MLKAGVLKPVHEATPWINSFVLVVGKDKLGNLKCRICLDLTNLNKVVVREPYHFKTPEGIVHLLADACIMSVCDCKKGYWHQKLDEASSFLTTFITDKLGRYKIYWKCLFGKTYATSACRSLLKTKLQQAGSRCFGPTDKKQVQSVIADDPLLVQIVG